MKTFKIRYALGGGFGGCDMEPWSYVHAVDIDDAISQAYEAVCELYDQYSGMHGISSIEDIMVEENCDEDEAEDIYIEERESWLEYEAKEVSNIGLTKIIEKLMIEDCSIFGLLPDDDFNTCAKVVAKGIRRIAKKNRIFISLKDWK